MVTDTGITMVTTTAGTEAGTTEMDIAETGTKTTGKAGNDFSVLLTDIHHSVFIKNSSMKRSLLIASITLLLVTSLSSCFIVHPHHPRPPRHHRH